MNNLQYTLRYSFLIIISLVTLGTKGQSPDVKIKNGDLTNIRLWIKLSDNDRFSGDYESAFDKLWDAMLLIKKNDFPREEIIVHRNIGILYDIYNKDSLALEYLNKALTLSKNFTQNKSIKTPQIISSYFSIANYWREREKYDIAIAYLDSCDLINENQKILPYITADRGYCYLKTHRLKEAEEHLKLAKLHLENQNYMVAVLSFLGDLYVEINQPDKAIFNYEQSLHYLESHNVLTEFKPDLCQKLANLYYKKGIFKKAFLYMEMSKISFEELFSTTNQRNKRLFEIKNKFKEKLEESKVVINQQEEVIKEKSKTLLWLLIAIVILVSGGFAVYLLINQRTRIKKLSIIREKDNEKNKAVLDAKSKELTAYSLKMIEKDDAIASLLEVIKKGIPEKFNSLNKQYNKGNDNLWEEFNMRFVELDSEFYNKLREKHPNLSPTEERHCALIKLNFDSHEMSKILNISLQSVHTSRYRIRKKLKLTHDESLEAYIGNI